MSGPWPGQAIPEPPARPPAQGPQRGQAGPEPLARPPTQERARPVPPRRAPAPEPRKAPALADALAAPVPVPSPRTPTAAPAPRSPAPPDRWLRWLLRPRPGSDESSREQALTSFLYPARDELLNRARLRPGETVLDVGTGHGLIGFGALEQVGAFGHVIFSDVSQHLLDQCREAVTAEGMLDRCDFLRASADALTGLDDAAVDVVTARSVLVYVTDKAAALREFHRVLKAGGRVVLIERVSRPQADPGWFLGYDVKPVADIAAKIKTFYASLQPQTGDPALNLDDRDLVGYAEAAGFRQIDCRLRADVRAARPPYPWDRFLRSSPNCTLPPIGEVLDYMLPPAEAVALTSHLKPLVESGTGHRRQILARLAAVKP